jgi:GNAT superfamily N-acetyltransferase
VLAPHVDERAVAEGAAALLIEPANFALLASDGERPVGIATCIVAGRAEPLLDSFHVAADARRRGVGSALLARLADELERRGFTTLTVAVVEQNARTRALYERLNAVRFATEPAPWAPEDVSEVHYRWDDLSALRG